MNRDAILATLIGFGLGLFITGVFIVGPNLGKTIKFPQINFPKITLPQFPSNKPGDAPAATPTPGEFKVTIDSPLPEAVVATAELLVSGSTFPNALVVVAGPNDEDVNRASTDGKFAGKITLNEGKNDVVVTAYNGNESISQTVTVFYTPEEF